MQSSLISDELLSFQSPPSFVDVGAKRAEFYFGAISRFGRVIDNLAIAAFEIIPAPSLGERIENPHYALPAKAERK